MGKKIKKNKTNYKEFGQYSCNINTDSFTEYLDSAFGDHQGTPFERLNSYLWQNYVFLKTYEEYEKYLEKNIPDKTEYLFALQIAWLAYDSACKAKKYDESKNRLFESDDNQRKRHPDPIPFY